MTKKNHSADSLKEIFEIAKSISSVLDVDALLKRIGSVAEKLLDAEASSIMLLDEDKQFLSFKVATGEKGGIVQKMKVKVGQGIAGTVAEKKKPLIVNDVAKDERFNSQMDKTSGFKTKSIICVPMFVEEDLIGVVEVLNKNEDSGFNKDDEGVLESLASLAAVSINNAKMAEDQRNFFVNVIEVLITAIESRDPKLSGHSWNVAQISTSIGRKMGLKDQEYKNLYYGALLHDIGMLNAREYISSGRSADDYTNHPRSGTELVHNINLLRGAEPIIRHHHENFDGTGYPDGLAGDKIPLGARIVAVAEAIEEMRMNGYAPEKINQMLKLGEHTRFDPAIVELYIKEVSEAVA
ncbi:MAG: GAF domain-containing protein [Endomicrobiales bacterium]|nr:GAF domain-containing protein [Endomicrobiales bacterium]